MSLFKPSPRMPNAAKPGGSWDGPSRLTVPDAVRRELAQFRIAEAVSKLSEALS